MRKFFLISLMAAIALPAAASAQSQSEIRRDRREVQEQREDLRDARRNGTRDEIREEREELRDAQRELREDRRDRRASQYRAPYNNWTYRTLRPGHRLQPGFYGSRYTVSNRGAYQLRAPGRYQRWIRYGDDILLVNVRTGRVIQVLRNRY